VAGPEDFVCGRVYSTMGATNAKVTPQDLRFYIHGLRLLDDDGQQIPLDLEQDRWQLGEIALLDFENASAACSNGTPETNDRVRGLLPKGRQYHGIAFRVGLPFAVNHSDPTSFPSPLDLTALFWSWNAGYKFLRLDLAYVGRPGGYAFHLGSTGCAPGARTNATPLSCRNENVVAVELPQFDPASNGVLVDVEALLRHTKLEGGSDGCNSSPGDEGCSPLFENLGLPFGVKPAGSQRVFRVGARAR
jgi:uncharacterized repeat protein (TIGR04052 family)